MEENFEPSMLELSYDEAIHLIMKLEYNYKKKGSPFIDKVKKFIQEEERKQQRLPF